MSMDRDFEKFFSCLYPVNCNVSAILRAFDSKFIVPVDNEDNGILSGKHTFSFISSFLPTWVDDNAEEYNRAFEKALISAMEILENLMKDFISRDVAKKIVANLWKNKETFNNGILEIPSQTFLNFGLEAIIRANKSKKEKANFVIFPYPAGGWAAQCIPPSLKEKFSQRVPFPKAWAGQTDLLPEISGVETATLCHNGCFFARAVTKDDVIKMCNIASC